MPLSVGTANLAGVLRQSGQIAVSKTLQDFDESGTASKISAVVTRLAPDSKLPGPLRDDNNLQAAETFRRSGLGDDILTRAFDRENGCLYSSNGQPVIFGRSEEGVPVFFANVDSQGRLHPLPNSDSAWGVLLHEDSNTVRIFENPLLMLADAERALKGATTVPTENISRFLLTDDPSTCLANLFSTHPELSQAELAVVPERIAQLEQAISESGFFLPEKNTEALERLSYESEIPLRKSVLALNPDGEKVLLCGEPQKVAEVLEYRQGQNNLGFQGTCGIVSSRNTLRLFGICTSEDELVHYAALKGLCVVDARSYLSGATNAAYRDRLLREWGLPGHIIKESTVAQSAEEFEKGFGVMAGVNAGILWNNPNCYGNGFSNHVVSLIGTERDQLGELTGVYICDSGRNRTGDSARYIPVDLWREALEVPGSSLNVTLRSRKREE